MFVSEIVNHQFPLTSFNYILFELVNYFFCIGIIAVFYKLKLIKFSHFLAWSVLFLSPFIFNYFLFDPMLFNDQFRYSAQVGIFREKGFDSLDLEFNSLNDLRSYGLDISSFIFSFSPVPFHLTVTSLAFTNRLLIFLIFVWLYKVSGKENSIFMFLIPSIVLYSSLSLRDPMIISLSVFFLYFVIKNKFISSFLILILISLLKFQNAILLFMIYAGKFIFFAHKSYLNLAFFIVAVFAIGIVFQEQIVSGLNFFRFAFYLEDIGQSSVSSSQESLIKSNESFLAVLATSLMLLPNFILMPFPLNASGMLQLMQSLENIFLLILTTYLFIKAYKVEKGLSLFLLLGLLIGLGVYSYVIFNIGTGVRYKFVYLYPYLLIFYFIAGIEMDRKSNKSAELLNEK